MRWFAALLVLWASVSQAAPLTIYALVCSVSCVAPDGTTQPAGTLLPGHLSQWDGVTPWAAPSGFAAVPYTGQTIYKPIPNTATQSPDFAGNSPIYGPDGAVEALTGWVPGATQPITFPMLLPGVYGAGGTFLCSSPKASVDCNFVTAGGGNLNFGNGDGMMVQFVDPGGTINGSLRVTLGGTSNPGPVYIDTVAHYDAINVPLILRGSGGGVGLGHPAAANASDCISAGGGTSCYGAGHPVSASPGTNQVCEQTLWAQTSAAAPVRLSVTGAAAYSKTLSVPLQTNGHGSFDISLDCTDLTTGDLAGWKAIGNFVSVVAALRLLNVAGVGQASATAGVLSSASLTVTADAANSNLNITVTPPAGNTHTITCGAVVRWMQTIL
jgi:hypothetical protein